MTIRTAMALAMMTSALVAPGAAMAKARHAARATEGGLTIAEQLRDAQQQIAQLQAQLIDLTNRVNAQQAALPAPAQAQLAQAQSDAAAASAKADTAIVAAKMADAKASKPAVPDVLKALANTSISGRMYFNASHVTHEVNGIKTGNTDNGGGFTIKRFYLGIDHKFDDVWSANLTMDADSPVATTSGGIAGRGFFIKKAYLQAKVRPELVIQAGASDLPWIPYVESIYGYRHIEKVLVDRTGFGTSSDWGVHVKGDLAGGLVSYQVSAVDGAGYRDPHFGRTIDFEGRLSARYEGFNLAVGAYAGKLGRNTVVAAGAPNALRTYSRFDALAAYQGKLAEDMPFTVGFEYLYAKNKAFNTTAPIAQSASEDAAEGFAGFASLGFARHYSVFGKYETSKPSKDLHPTFKEDYFNVGLQWSPARIVDLALVYKRDQAVNGAYSVGSLQSGVIGCSTSAAIVCAGKGTYDEFGLYGQFRF